MSTPATRLPVLGRAVETEAVETQKQNERDGDHTKPKGKGWVERKGGKRQKTRELEAAAVKSTKAMLLNTVGENARAEKDWKAIRKSAEMALQFDIYVSGSTSVARICGRATLLRNMFLEMECLRIDVRHLSEWDAALWTQSRVNSGTKNCRSFGAVGTGHCRTVHGRSVLRKLVAGQGPSGPKTR